MSRAAQMFALLLITTHHAGPIPPVIKQAIHEAVTTDSGNLCDHTCLIVSRDRAGSVLLFSAQISRVK